MCDGNWIESKDQSVEGIRLVQTGNIGEGIYLDKPNHAKFISDETFSRLKCTEVFRGDVLVSRLPTPVGRACLLPHSNTRMVTAVDCTIIRFNKGKFLPEYFIYFSMSTNYLSQVNKHLAGSTRVRISRKNLESIIVPLPPLETQKLIAQTLDTAAELLAMRKQQLAELDNLIKSTFYDMFGDVATNEKKWEVEKLGNISGVQGGLQVTSKRVENSIELPYLRVANVYRDLLDLREIKMIKVTEAEAEKVCLVKGDILIVEGHGNPTEIGRSAVWDASIQPCLHQNHLIRVRVDTNFALPIFISHYINSPSGKQQMFKVGKTTSGLNTISTKNVKETFVVLPPLPLQTQFAEIVTQIEAQKALVKKAIDETQTLFDSLMSEYFD